MQNHHCCACLLIIPGDLNKQPTCQSPPVFGGIRCIAVMLFSQGKGSRAGPWLMCAAVLLVEVWSPQSHCYLFKSACSLEKWTWSCCCFFMIRVSKHSNCRETYSASISESFPSVSAKAKLFVLNTLLCYVLLLTPLHYVSQAMFSAKFP